MILMTVLSMLSTQVPPAWSCDPVRFADTVCDCGCGVVDDDCDSRGFAACERDNCSNTQAPWEHENESCMASSCGDGWRKEGLEACDDGDRGDGGGCNADCSAVNAGFACGVGAEGCSAVGEGEGEGEGDADSGCAGAPLPLPLALLVALRRRQRQVS